MTTLILSIMVMGFVMIAMAVGVLVGRTRLQHGCSSGKHPVGPDGQPLRCDSCTCEEQGRSKEVKSKREKRD